MLKFTIVSHFTADHLVCLGQAGAYIYALPRPRHIHTVTLNDILFGTPIINLATSGFSEVKYNLSPLGEMNIFSNDLLFKIISEFFKEFIKDDNKYFLLLKIQYENGSIKSLHKGIVVNSKSINKYIKYINSILSIKSNDYSEDLVIDVVFNFFLIDKSREKYYVDKWQELKLAEPMKLDSFGTDFMFPINRNYLTWGFVMFNSNNLMIINSENYQYRITNNTKIEVFSGENLLLTFSDTDFKDNIFIRDINNVKYYIKNESIILKTIGLKTSFLKKLGKSKKTAPKIITIDIETIVKDGVHKAYLFSMYDGKETYSWFSNNAKSLFDNILKPKYRGYQIYAHNLSRFDVIFLMKDIADLRSKYNIDILKREDKFISIKIVNKDKNVSITLKDSFLLLPASLASLSSQFNVEVIKGIEPVFTGDKTSEYYMDDLSHYSKDIERINDLDIWKNKIQMYCEQDCVALYQVLIKFRELVFEKWNIIIDKYPTTPSLSFAIFRTYYMGKYTIPLTKGKVFDFIRESFTGGSTEMYKPYGENIYVYDVNSLYPSRMNENVFPVGNITQFEGDITILDNIYWIGDVQISTKRDLYQPYLQIHHDTGNGLRTISPNGSWTMKLNSPEYHNALKDYNIQINNGYFFEAKDIFSTFVRDMYDLRLKYLKTEPMNFIAKLIMNSLYGRFAMKPILEKHIICGKDEFKVLSEKCGIIDIIDLGDKGYFLTITNNSKKDNSNSSISIASAVTAYARIHMSHFKNNPNFTLLYTDTDSVFVDRPLEPNLIGKELGKMKLEYIFKEAVFLGPKIYAGITTDGRYICKVKGFKDGNLIPFDAMKSLLAKDASLDLSHIKWFRYMESAEIVMKKQVYDLQKTSNKREFVYINDIAVDTKPFRLD